jgi:LCP family protein required for cell wall assembly
MGGVHKRPGKGELMSETPDTNDDASSGHSAGPAGDLPTGDPQAKPTRHNRKHRPSRLMITLGSLLGVVILVAVGIFAYVNFVESSIPRVKVNHLVALPGLLGATFLINTAVVAPAGMTPAEAAEFGAGNLIMLLHTNANGDGGGSVSFPGSVMVPVPGHGTEPLWEAFQQGGPSLLVQTLTQATGISINHYARVDFTHITGLVDAVGGVDVTVPTATTGSGYSFPQGVNHLTGITAVNYARDPYISAQDRLERQENLFRTLITTIAGEQLFTHPLTTVHVLSAVTSMLAVDSNFTNPDIDSLVKQFASLSADAATFLTAPTQTVGKNQVFIPALDNQLWAAVKTGSLAAYAKDNPSTVTPADAP